MATTITMPQLGETVTEGTVERWLKQAGEPIEKYEAFVEVSTDKVNSEVPAPVTGTLREILVQEGTTVATGTPIAVIDEVGAATGTNAPGTEPTQQVATQGARDQMAESANFEPVPGFNIPEMPTQHVAPAASAPVRTNGQGAATGNGAEAALRGVSPAVRRLAREHHIDIRSIQGSGANGRVTAEDVLTASRMGPAAAVGQAISVGTNFAARALPQRRRKRRQHPVPATPARTASRFRARPFRSIPRAASLPSAWWKANVPRRTRGRWSKSTSRTCGSGARARKTASNVRPDINSRSCRSSFARSSNRFRYFR